MYCRSIALENYRNIEKARIEFNTGVNVLFGCNAQGKTNVLEAVYTFARGKSFRGASDREISSFGKNEYFCELEYEAGGRKQKLSTRYYEGAKVRLHNGVKIDRLFDMIGRFRAVFFCPEHLALVKGGAGERRSLLNIALSQSMPGYIRWLSDYNTVLANRNALLRSDGDTAKNRQQLEVWSAGLAAYAADICIARRAYISRLEHYMNMFMKDMTDGAECVTLKYRCDADNSTVLKADLIKEYNELLTKNTEKERSSGATLYGIHRDDIIIKLNGASARHFTSQGQQRSIALALKLSEGEISRELMGEYPVFLFDDVLSELDESRRQYVLNSLCGRQIIITTCEKSLFDGACDLKLIRVENGKYTEI